jgi:pimeloyl-ACP methyl ester carboxylesterase
MEAICYLAVMLAAWYVSHSVSGFLTTGVGLVLMLDRYVLRRLPWPVPIVWSRELLTRAGYFVVGAVAFALIRPGVVPWWEAAYRGAMLSLLAFLLEAVVLLLTRGPGAERWRWPLRIAVVAMLLVLAPAIAVLHPLHIVPKRTPASQGLAVEEVRFTTQDGVQLAAWLLPHEKAHGNVIFCHGHGRNRGQSAALLPTLHALGLNILAFDFRGHGDSEGHTCTFGRCEVHDLCAAVTYLERRCPGQPLFLVGVSLGGAVALQALPELPQVRGLWSEGAFSRFSHVEAEWFSWVPRCLRAPVAPFYERVGWLDCGFWSADISPHDALARVSCVPIYFCHGVEDRLIPLSEGRDLYATYAGPKCHWWVAGASHYNVRQRNHDEYLRRLRVFLVTQLRQNASTGLQTSRNR